MAKIDVNVPDIGDFKDVPIIEILVKAGRRREGRAVAGHARVRQGDDGRALADRRRGLRGRREDRRQSLDGDADRAHRHRGWRIRGAQRRRPLRRPPAAPAKAAPAAPTKSAAAPASPKTATIDITVPDIGDFKDVPVIEVLVKAGDTSRPNSRW